MTAALNLKQIPEQHFIYRGINWENFKSIQQGFENLPGVRLFFHLGELEILATSPEHEIVKGNLGFLVEDFMLNQGIEYIGTGSFSLEKEGETSAQADESYCFVEKKSIPDLAIEVVITSGGPSKLKRYQALGVKEVWFWEDGVISMFHLENGEYQAITQSGFIPEINIKLLAECAAIEIRLEAIKKFRGG